MYVCILFQTMIIRSADFVCSNTEVSKLPEPLLPEYAFIGRSNVGKSSLINMLTNKKKLAKTSQTPGKTRLINHFLINENWYLVDLPGYGFARASRSDKGSWEKFIKTYFESRENLQSAMVLIDSRLAPQKIDLEFVTWLGENEIPFIIIFTKSDKQSSNKTNDNVALFKDQLRKNWEELPSVYVTSAEKKSGADPILAFIDEVNKSFIKPEKKINISIEKLPFAD